MKRLTLSALMIAVSCFGCGSTGRPTGEPTGVNTCKDLCQMTSQCAWAQGWYSIEDCETECDDDELTASSEACPGRWTTVERCLGNQFECSGDEEPQCDEPREDYFACLNGLLPDEETTIEISYVVTQRPEPTDENSPDALCAAFCTTQLACDTGLVPEICVSSCRQGADNATEDGCSDEWVQAQICENENRDCDWRNDSCEELYDALYRCW